MTHFFILIDRGMLGGGCLCVQWPEDDISASSPDWLQITNYKRFQLSSFLSPECWHSWVCCPVTSLRNLCEIFWPGRNPIFIWDTNYLWTKYLYLVMQWQTIQWPVKMIEIYKLCHNWIVCQPAQPRSVNIPCQAWQWQRRRTGISEDERQNIIDKEHNY